ncbi:alpha/beta fold hydrolase [Rhodoplanes roseus]|uniref:AB hydrolase-1 domain-containing protein n=1 Tax=Rhodoplanes roseus TaxID=29409 RepID=A0A327L7P0_9BRAD|nr:alpha/beta hydrolase [Rhodoplanes roseus]RAI45522.1 hypothetical protein CH341_03355 [Rhodoplanes roseus]
MAYGSHHLTVAAEGGAAHVIVSGAGAPVLLLHGLGGLAEEVMAPLVNPGEGHRLLAIDRPGYGGSEPQPACRMGPDRQADWLACVIARLDIGAPVVVAHSFGAAVGLWLAHRHPDCVKGLVLVAPFCRPTRPARMPLLRLAAMERLGRPLRWALPQLAPLIAGRKLAAAFAPDAVPPHVKRLPFAVAAQPGAVLAMAAELRGFNAAMADLGERLHEVTCPAVVIGGERDPVAPFDLHGEWLRARLPRCTVLRVADAGHMIHHVRPRTITRAIDRVSAASASSPAVTA